MDDPRRRALPRRGGDVPFTVRAGGARDVGTAAGAGTPNADARDSTDGVLHEPAGRVQAGTGLPEPASDLFPPTPAAGGRKRPRQPPTPTQRALGLLVRREHSRKELSRKLAARGVAREDADAAVGRLAEAGWQDDARFAELLVRSRAEAGHGPLRIRAELATHALDRDAVAAAMATYADQWDRLARASVRRRFGEEFHADPALRRKAAEFLIRRGFASASIRAATRFDPDGDGFD